MNVIDEKAGFQQILESAHMNTIKIPSATYSRQFVIRTVLR